MPVKRGDNRQAVFLGVKQVIMAIFSIYKINNKKGVLKKILLPALLLIITVPVYTQLPPIRETVWLQTTSEIYVSGQEIYFKAAVLETDTYKPSTLSTRLRVELINNEGERIFQKNYALSGAQLTSRIKLPPGLPTGWYHLRAYTNWMRNFPEDDFAWSSFRVAWPGDMNDKRYITENDSICILLTDIGLNKNNGQAGECSIYTSDIHGKPISAEGFILSSPSDTAAWILTDDTGLGVSEYNKNPGENYKAFIKGYAPSKTLLSIEETDHNKPVITVSEDRSNVYVRVGKLALTGIYKLLVHKTYSWYWFKESHTVTDNIEFTVPKSSLPGGLVQFSFADNSNELLAASLWSDYDPGNTGVTIYNHSPHKGMRSRYAADYRINASSRDDKGLINVLVMKENPFYPAGDYLPGLPGWTAGYSIPAAEAPFSAWLRNNSYPEEIVRKFFKSASPPHNPASSTPDIPLIYHPETRNTILSGRLTNKNNGSGIEDVYFGLTILNDGSFYSSATDNTGSFVFNFPDITGPKDYIINYVSEVKPEWSLHINSLFDNVTYIPPAGPAEFTEKEMKYLQEQSELQQLKEVYSQTDKGIDKNNNIAADSGVSDSYFYGQADIKVLIDNFITLPNLREVIYEVVPYVNIRKRNNYTIPLITGDHLYPSSYPSLILFDGIPVYDFTEILDLSPDRIRIIEVINQFYIHGNNIFSGIMNIESVNRDFGGLKLPETSILGTIDFPLRAESDLINNEYIQDKTLPVLDNILLWKTKQAEAGEEISFTTGDNPGRYRLMVYGYDENGKWLWSSESFTLKTTNE